jgi:glycosyltransferase involved in cell wall biosynthesis
MKQPLFSCVIPVKGERPFLDETFRSLEGQELADDLEVIVQDGDIERDGGQSDALNRGFAKAQGEWLFWLNSDDLLLPGALCKVKKAIERQSGKSGRQEIEWIAGNQLLIDKKGKILKCSVGNGWHDWLYRHAVPHVYGPSSFFRRELFERVGGFDVSLGICMDWDLWIRFMKAGARFVRINDYLWAQRQWQGSKTQRRISGAERVAHRSEINSMFSKNAFQVTASGLFLNRVWRLLNGNYARECLDTFRMRGKCAV